METLKYTIIKNKAQYKKYCNLLEELILQNKQETQEEIELLTLLIEKWDHEHNTFNHADPVALLKALMKDHDLKGKDLVDMLDLSKGTISKILNYQKGFSKKTIRILSDYFKISQEAFNRPYKLVDEVTGHSSDASMMNTKKKNIEV